MGWFRPTLARTAPVRASECWYAAAEDTIYATASPLGAFLQQTYRNLLGHQLHQKSQGPRLSSFDGRDHSSCAVELPCTLPNVSPLKGLRRSFACWEQTTEAPGLPGQAAREAPLEQRQQFTEYVVPSLSRCTGTASAMESHDSAKPLAIQTAPAAESVRAADKSISSKKLALKQEESLLSASPVSCQAPARPITSIESGTPSAACQEQAAHCALLLTDMWLRHQAQNQATATSGNAPVSALVSCGMPDRASDANRTMKVEEAAADEQCQLAGHVDDLELQLEGASHDQEQTRTQEPDAPEHAPRLQQETRARSSRAEHAEAQPAERAPLAEEKPCQQVSSAAQHADVTAATECQDNLLASATPSTHPPAPAPESEIIHIGAPEPPSLASLDKSAAPAVEDGASSQDKCQTHSLAQQPAQTSAADSGRLREPVLGQRRSVPSGPSLSAQSHEGGSSSSGNRSPGAEKRLTFAQRRVNLLRLMPAARKAEAVQAAVDRAAALEAEARCAGQPRAGLIAHRDSLMAYQKASRAWDEAPNMYWDDPEALVQAALERRAAQRKERSAGQAAPNQAAPKSAQPQRRERAPQEASPSCEPATPPGARPAARLAAQSTPEQRTPAPAEQGCFSFPQLRESSSSPESWQCNWGTPVAAH